MYCLKLSENLSHIGKMMETLLNGEAHVDRLLQEVFNTLINRKPQMQNYIRNLQPTGGPTCQKVQLIGQMVVETFHGDSILASSHHPKCQSQINT